MNPRLWSSVAGGLLMLASSDAGAQLSASDAGAILIFPKIVVDASWDSVVQISNDANRTTRARCSYVNGARVNPELPPGPSNPPLWSELDFRIVLQPQQPTHWVASRGRVDMPDDAPCDATRRDCDGAGVDPGLVPQLPSGFSGELLCIETDESGAPRSGNALRGQATLQHTGGEIITYAGSSLAGTDNNDGDHTMCLGGTARAGCAGGPEYAACGASWVVHHSSEYDDREVDGAAEETTLTIVPCAQNFETQQPTAITLQFQVVNEFEQALTASTSVTCWADIKPSAVSPAFTREVLGGNWLRTRVRAASPMQGFTLMASGTRQDAFPPTYATTAISAWQEDDSFPAATIVIPAEVLP